MKSNSDDQMNLDEPHFDEEATLLAARPVVPLDEVSVPRRSKGGLALVLAIGGGLIIGLLAATLMFRYLSVSQQTSDTTAVTEQPVDQDQQKPSNDLANVAGGVTPITDESATLSSNEEPPPVEPAEIRESKPEGPRPIRTRESEVEPQPRIIVREPRLPSDDEEDEERAIRRAQRQEERRERRRAARRAQREEIDSNEDLSRIREIFEGKPRP